METHLDRWGLANSSEGKRAGFFTRFFPSLFVSTIPDSSASFPEILFLISVKSRDLDRLFSQTNDHALTNNFVDPLKKEPILLSVKLFILF